MTGAPPGVRLAGLLLDLEAALRNAGLWEAQAPAPAALASTQPFCIDTLDFTQWLQFVFLPRIRELLDNQLPLPDRCAIAAMAEMDFSARARRCDTLVAVLRRIDALIEEPSSPAN
jgi:uncharacterized protein YqcC (DUF446 family)